MQIPEDLTKEQLINDLIRLIMINRKENHREMNSDDHDIAIRCMGMTCLKGR